MREGVCGKRIEVFTLINSSGQMVIVYSLVIDSGSPNIAPLFISQYNYPPSISSKQDESRNPIPQFK